MRDLTGADLRKDLIKKYCIDETACVTCVFWSYCDPSLGNRFGECRRRAPSIVPASTPNQFPVVSVDELCGEYEPVDG